MEAEVPVTWYNITSANNFFSFLYPTNQLLVPLTISEGNYDISLLIESMKVLINASKPPSEEPYILRLNQYTYKVEVVSVSKSDKFELGFPSPLGTALGFSGTNYISNDDGIISGDLVPSLNNMPYLYLKCPSLIKGVDNGVISTSGDTSVLTRIQCSENFGFTTMIKDSSPWARIVGSITSTLQMYLCFRGDIRVNLNASPWSCCLEFARS
jgi:hypothetical protein